MPVIEGFAARYRRHLLRGQRAKLGLRDAAGASAEADAALAAAWLALLQAGQVDFTLAWRRLADAAEGDDAPLRALFADAGAPEAWLARWRERCAREDEGGDAGAALGGDASALRRARTRAHSRFTRPPAPRRRHRRPRRAPSACAASTRS